VNDQAYQLYPFTYDNTPGIPSPFLSESGIEVVVAFLHDSSYAIIPVTMENGKPLHYSNRVGTFFGKDQQLHVNSGDFPTLAETGLHAEEELDIKELITGYNVNLINFIARPERFSWEGFIAEDEDILSVIKGDNRLVRSFGFTHPQMARPLFHMWNIILMEIELKNWKRFWDHIVFIMYNGRKIMLEAEQSKGWQKSIFQDEIQGRFNLAVKTELTEKEKRFLKEKYSHLTDLQFSILVNRLISLHYSEMLPYYIMRYGFYEGHTGYRGDPVAISFIFGLKQLEEIENLFTGNLYNVLTKHYCANKPRK
jgi:hypothetical protein